jgi:hypothetical protein
MSTTQQDKPGSKPRQRRSKAEQRGQKPGQEQSPKLEQNDEQIGITEAATETVATDAAAIAEAATAAFAATEPSVRTEAPLIGQAAIGEVEPADAPSINPGAPADNGSIGIQTIANAYSSYANKSLQQTGSFVERLMGARSFDKAIEVQSEFARQACANVVVESLNICEIYGRFVRQFFKSWQGFAVGTRRK